MEQLKLVVEEKEKMYDIKKTVKEGKIVSAATPKASLTRRGRVVPR